MYGVRAESKREISVIIDTECSKSLGHCIGQALLALLSRMRRCSSPLRLMVINEKVLNVWTARSIPLILVAIVGYASYVIVGPLSGLSYRRIHEYFLLQL